MGKQKSTDTHDERFRNWCLVVYPESAPQNWRDILDSKNIRWCESPLHDKDLNADNTPKKPHWHVILAFDGKKSYSQIKEICDELHTVIPQKCMDMKGAVRYMVHLDNPEKYQYSVEDIKAHGGFDLKVYLRATAGERYQCVKDMIEWCKVNHIVEMQDLMDYAMYERYDDWFPLLCDSCALVMSYYLKSARHRKEPSLDSGEYPMRYMSTDDGSIIDTSTGEIRKS